MDSFLLALYWVLFRISIAQELGKWIVPPSADVAMQFLKDDIYTTGDQISLEWLTSKEEYGIYLWQQSVSVGAAVLGQPIYTKIIGGVEQSQFNWTITQQTFDLKQSNVFFLSLGQDQDNLTDCLISHYFNLTQPDPSAPSSSGTASLPTPTASPTTTSLPSNGAASSDGASSSDGGSKLGIGLGIGLGVPLVLLCLYFIYAGYRKRQKKQHTQTSEAGTVQQTVPERRSVSPKELYASEIARPANDYGQPPQYRPAEPMAELPIHRPAYDYR